MKLASLAFFLLLVYAHADGESERLVGRPLSMFRDQEQAWMGYALFALLMLASSVYAAALARYRKWGEVAVAGLTVLLLLALAATPSTGELHLVCALALLALLFGYYAVLLYRAETFWLLAHLAVPVALALATRFHSYGIWQKGFIVYFVLAAVIRHHLLMRQISRADAPGRPKKPRKAYRLDLMAKRPPRLSGG
jgi:hypothetical protein